MPLSVCENEFQYMIWLTIIYREKINIIDVPGVYRRKSSPVLNSSKNHLFLSEKSSFGRFSDKICYTKSF